MLRRLFAGTMLLALAAWPAHAAELAVAIGDTGNALEVARAEFDAFEAATGHTVRIVPMPSSTTEQFDRYKLWLAAQDASVDVYTADIVWAPQFATQLLDLGPAMKDVAGEHFPAILASQTVEGRLVAMPVYTDAPALFYRKDLLEKHGASVPKTWDELAETAKRVMEAERAAGNPDIWGFVFQAKAYEGLTCNALEWIASSGGGNIVEADGAISVDNDKAAAALDRARSWIGDIAPLEVLSFGEDESRALFQSGNAVFMRNWPYAYALGNADDSAVKGKFDVVPLPAGESGKPAATLGGWNLAVPKFARDPEAAIALVKFLSSTERQKLRAIATGALPTIPSLYTDPEIGAAQPIVPRFEAIVLGAVPRPSAVTRLKYNEVSKAVWTAVHKTLSGEGTAAENLAALDAALVAVKGRDW